MMVSSDRIVGLIHWRSSLRRRSRYHAVGAPPLIVWVPAFVLALSMLLPLFYLVLRAAGASHEAWELLFRVRTVEVLWRSLLLVLTVTTFSVVIAVPLAWLTVRTDLPLRRFWGILTALPLVIPSYVGGFLIVSALGPKGLLQNFLEATFGVERLPDIYGLPGATITLVLLSYPYVLLTTRGVLNSLDPAVEEAARTLGASPWRTMFRITLPRLRPSIAAGSLLVALYTLSDFGAVSLLRYETFTWTIYQQYQSAFERSIPAVLSLLLVGLAIVIVTIDSLSRGRMAYYQIGRGASRTQRIIKLGTWKWVAVAFCIGVTLVAVVLPVSVLSYWFIRGVLVGEASGAILEASLNSISVSGLAAVTAAACSVPVAVVVVRYPGLFAWAVERLSFAGYAVPGIVVALSLVFFGANFARPIYQTVWLLLLAYVVLFFPAALGATRSALLQINPSIEEAARSLGGTAFRTSMTITVPLMRSGVLAGAALVFLVTMKELPATLILSPLGFNSLATIIWSASSEAFFARAAAPALLLILLSSVPMGFLVFRTSRAGS